MPLSINVGLSRKASKDYQSTGVSINIVAEIDQSLLAKPDELQKQIDGLYQQAQNALDRHVGAPEPTRQPPREQRETSNNGGNGRAANGNGTKMTASQRRAIEAIADRLGLNPRSEARRIIGAEFETLSVRQASELIDRLKAQQQHATNRC
jgi:hypothetical protein